MHGEDAGGMVINKRGRGSCPDSVLMNWITQKFFHKLDLQEQSITSHIYA